LAEQLGRLLADGLLVRVGSMPISCRAANSSRQEAASGLSPICSALAEVW
jgi:hypothetical protein